MFADYEGDLPDFDIKVEGEVPVFITRNLVMFPGVLMPVLVGRKATLTLVKYLEKHPGTVFAVISQKDGNIDEPEEKDLYHTGIYARLVRVFDIPGAMNGGSEGKKYTKDDFSKMTLSERTELFNTNKKLYDELKGE